MELLQPTSVENFSESYVCPKCHAPNRVDAQACQSCGVVFNRFYAQVEDRFETDFRLAGFTPLIEMWQTVLSDYENPATHRRFVEACAEQGALEYAAYRYRILNQVINDDIASSQLARIAGLAAHHFETASEPETAFALPRYHLWFFVFAGLFLGVGIFGGPSFEALGYAALIFLGGLWAIRLASEHRWEQ